MSRRLYFRGDNWFGRLLRFLNILEPDNMVLSISRLMAWLTLGLFVFVAIKYPDNITALITTLLTTLAAGGHYAYRRMK